MKENVLFCGTIEDGRLKIGDCLHQTEYLGKKVDNFFIGSVEQLSYEKVKKESIKPYNSKEF